MTPETKLKNEVRKYLKGVPGLWFVKTASTAGLKVGTPDFLICYRGRFVAIELKAGKGKPTKKQVHEISRIIGAGGFAAACWSLEEVQAVLAKVESVHEWHRFVVGILEAMRKDGDWLPSALVDKLANIP